MASLSAAALPYRDINVQISDHSYLFSSPSSPNAQSLVIDRPTGDIRLQEPGAGSLSRATQVMSIAGILGMIQLRLDKYIIFITKAQPVGRLRGHMVYKIASTQVMPIRKRQIHDPDEDTFLTLLKTFLASGAMYFSYSVDLTNSFQRQAQSSPAQPMWMRADDRFFWNKFVSSDLIKFRSLGGGSYPGPQAGIDPFILPVMYGMLEIRPTTFKQTPVTLALISRRSRHRGGTRFFTRGLDEDGNPANYNETEQIVILNDGNGAMGGFAGSSDMQSGKLGNSQEMQVMSYVQIRGSVPAHWAEVNDLKYTPKIQLTRRLEAAVPAAQAHLSQQINIYGDTYLINLINQQGREKQVKDWFEHMVSLVKASQPKLFEHLHYVYFDFHHETKGMNMSRAYNLVERMENILPHQAYFRASDAPASKEGRLEVRHLQNSVMRTNCMDCLDRTNVVQSMFARYMLNRIFVEAGLMASGSNFTSEDPAFEELFRNLWGDNADVVSGTYSGTGAMKTDVTRTGTRTKVGALQDGRIGVTRFFLNNFMDGPRQDAFDLFLGTYLPGSANIGSSLVFADRRPVLIQAVPYLFGFSMAMIFIAYVSTPGSATIPLRLFSIVWFLVSAWSAFFIKSHGKLYVNWPKLRPQQYVIDGYNEHLTKATKDPILGPHLKKYMVKRERGLSMAQYTSAEEGTLQFPGGHMEKNETNFSCARREAKEETGLDVLVECQAFSTSPLEPGPRAPPDTSSLEATPLQPFAHIPEGSSAVAYLPVSLDPVTTPWEARVVAVINQFFADDGRHYVTLFVRCIARDEAALPRIMEPEKCAGWEWRSWEEIKAYEREGGGKLFAPMIGLLRQYPADHDLFKRPDEKECLLL
ncbi:Phosphoinositide phosphatase SAC1 [Ceratocystis lukuohia]|uniref:Phosphoinositide phosphatase SAC1 n=1 Tax=Ceratocystis lukuohia TaxID=2019550 RepID=A0ABR4MC50_9PEZI